MNALDALRAADPARRLPPERLSEADEHTLQRILATAPVPRDEHSTPTANPARRRRLVAELLGATAVVAASVLVLVLAVTPHPRGSAPSAPLASPVSNVTRATVKPLHGISSPKPNRQVPTMTGLAPVADRPGLPFRVLPYSPTDHVLLIAWVESPTPGCGQVDKAWILETKTQVVITLHLIPASQPCLANGTVRIQSVPLQAPIADRTPSAFKGLAPVGGF